MSQLNIQYELRVLLTDHIKEIRRMMSETNDHSSHLVEQSLMKKLILEDNRGRNIE